MYDKHNDAKLREIIKRNTVQTFNEHRYGNILGVEEDGIRISMTMLQLRGVIGKAAIIGSAAAIVCIADDLISLKKTEEMINLDAVAPQKEIEN